MTEEFTDAPNLTIEQAIENLRGADLGLRIYAAWWIGRFRVDDPTAIEVLIGALLDEDDRTGVGGYPLRRNAARALGKLGDTRAVPALIDALSCADFYVREAAAQALEALGDPQGIPKLIALLEDRVPGTLPATEPPQLTQPFDAILEALGTLDARSTKEIIQPFLNHPVARIQYAAARALYQLVDNPAVAASYGDRLVQALQGEDLQLRRSALADLGAIGYLEAAEPIAATLAENSLKLIALKGLLEKQLQPNTEPSLAAIRVMNLMDGLL